MQDTSPSSHSSTSSSHNTTLIQAAHSLCTAPRAKSKTVSACRPKASPSCSVILQSELLAGPETGSNMPFGFGKPADKAGPDASGPSTSSSSKPDDKRYVSIHGTPVPMDWLLQGHDDKRFPTNTLVKKEERKWTHHCQDWARNKDQMIAAAAAGFHVALFAYNLAFWGSEGMPPDRYWPANSRLKMGIKPGRYGNLDGTRRIWYENLGTMEGL